MNHDTSKAAQQVGRDVVRPYHKEGLPQLSGGVVQVATIAPP